MYILDLPYPRKKCRIMEVSVPGGKIIKGRKYIISDLGDMEWHDPLRQIVMGNKWLNINPSSKDILIFGDGEGSFVITEKKSIVWKLKL